MRNAPRDGQNNLEKCSFEIGSLGNTADKSRVIFHDNYPETILVNSSHILNDRKVNLKKLIFPRPFSYTVSTYNVLKTVQLSSHFKILLS